MLSVVPECLHLAFFTSYRSRSIDCNHVIISIHIVYYGQCNFRCFFCTSVVFLRQHFLLFHYPAFGVSKVESTHHIQQCLIQEFCKGFFFHFLFYRPYNIFPIFDFHCIDDSFVVVVQCFLRYSIIYKCREFLRY